MFIKEDALSLYSKESKIFIDGYKLQSELSSKSEDLCAALKMENKLEDGMKVVVNNKTYKTHLFILNNYQNEPAVKIIFFHDISSIGELRNYLLLGLFISLTIILLALIRLIYRRIGLYQNEVISLYAQQIEKLNESEHRFELLYKKST